MRERRLKNEINVVPYIDVMLVLLVIFMVTAPMMTTASIDVPSAAKTKQAPAEAIYLNIDEDKSISLTVAGKTSGKRRQAGKRVNFEPDSAFRGEKKQKSKAAKKEARAAKKPSAKTQKIAAATKAKRAAKKKVAE